MKPIILDTPGHESAMNDIIAEKAKNRLSFEYAFIDEALKFRFDPESFKATANALEKLSNTFKSIPQPTPSKHAKARHLRFRAKHSYK